MARRRWSIRLCLVGLLAALARAEWPYHPTRVLRSGRAGEPWVYVFLQPVQSERGLQLLALNVSTPMDASAMPYTTVSNSFPFQQDQRRTAFTPTIDNQGKISVYAGTCDTRASVTKLWSLTTKQNHGLVGDWSQATISANGALSDQILSGANFLASAISFSADVDDDAHSTMYVFGGMCPAELALSESWVSAANYSDSMLTLTPTLHSSSSSAYELGITKSRGPPVAEAGYSLTGLRPSFLNTTDASGRIRQQNYVILGGHTQQAFINMSQLALFSLPQESWSFPTIEPPASPGTADVDSRSGHTAVLTDDGTRVVIVGGWVGDVTNPASPQLLVLELGKGYGGTGPWRWAIPSSKGPGLDDGAGIYGHGAVMLPGDVVMVVGGYAIPPLRSTKIIKRSEPAPNAKTYFFNVTSGTWLTAYTKPAHLDVGSHALQAEPSGGLSSSSKKAALGSGLAFGLGAVLAAVLIGVWYARRVKKRRQARDEELRQLGFAVQRPHNHHSLDADMERYDWADHEKSAATDGEGISAGHPHPHENPPLDQAYPWATDLVGPQVRGTYPAGLRGHRGTEAERTGLLVEIPSPTRGLRRSLHSRGRNGERLMSSYQLASAKDDSRRIFPGGDIHPIDECDELDEPPEVVEPAGGNVLAESDSPEYQSLPLTPTPDPFRDPGSLGEGGGGEGEADHGDATLRPGSAMSTSPERERQLEIQEWVNDWAMADAHLRGQRHRRRSPERDPLDRDFPRTSSNLSERSQRSTISVLSQPLSSSASGGHPRRTISQRSAIGRLAAMGPLRTLSNRSSAYGGGHPQSNMSTSGGSRSSPSPSPSPTVESRRSQSLQLFSRIGAAEDNNHPIRPISTDFTQLQIEGEALLPRPSTPTGGASGVGGRNSSSTNLREDSGMVNKGKSRAVGWLGSVRRALPSLGGGGGVAGQFRSSSPTRSTHLLDQPITTTTFASDHLPRRAASAGAAYWRTKQGAADWGAEASSASAVVGSSRDRASPAAVAADDVLANDEDWDIEAAVERRVVQVMFTVPKEKLRVINSGGEDLTSLLSVDEPSQSIEEVGGGGTAAGSAHENSHDTGEKG